VSLNFFKLLQLPETFVIDLEKLDQNYQTLQKEIHPDRFASSGNEAKLESVKKTAQANDAYHTLKSPIRRAEYLLHLQGINMHDEKYTTVPQAFLIQQMEWREELETHKQNKLALERLAQDIQQSKHEMINQLPRYFENKNNLDEAVKITRELNFIEKIEQHIDDALIEMI
jgi:molecular chaperone HscB